MTSATVRGLIVLVAHASLLAAQQRSPQAWREDIDSLVTRIERIHPRPWAHTTRVAFLHQVSDLRTGARSQTDGQLLAGMMRLVASLEDGHTAITDLGPAGGRWFPVRFYLFSDGLWITAIDSAHQTFAGAKLQTIGNTPADTAVARILELFSGDNTWGRREGPALLANAVLLQALGISASDDTLPLQTTKGHITLRAVATTSGDISWWQYGEISGPPGSQLVTAFAGRTDAAYRDPSKNSDLPLHLRGRRAYWWTYLPGDSSIYFACNNVVAKSRYSSLSLLDELGQALARVDSAPAATRRFILDMRYNSGGDGSLTPAIVNAFVKRDASIGRRGRFFIITGRKTFSAAAGTVIDLMRHTAALLVGEPMGVPFNAAGDPAPSTLPRHHIGVIISTNSTVTTALEGVRVIPVQIPAPMSGEDYFTGRDPAIDAVLGAATPYPEVIGTLQTQGAVAAHALWTEQVARYGSLDYWEPFTYEALNGAAYQLLDQKRTADAVAGFELNSQRFPTRWEVWDSLGDAYRAAGRTADAIAAYRRALALAPDNWNVEHQRAGITELSGSH